MWLVWYQFDRNYVTKEQAIFKIFYLNFNLGLNGILQTNFISMLIRT